MSVNLFIKTCRKTLQR